MTKLLRFLLRAYQLTLSPLMGARCRFYPSCSNYALEALQVHGAARGSYLAVKRVCRCHPWNAGGFDPVPPASQPVPHSHS
jgi:putative membrane protein insertion efficiency factor